MRKGRISLWFVMYWTLEVIAESFVPRSQADLKNAGNLGATATPAVPPADQAGQDPPPTRRAALRQHPPHPQRQPAAAEPRLSAGGHPRCQRRPPATGRG